MQEKTGEKLILPVKRDENGQVVSGNLNPFGRPKGALGFATKWRAFIDKVAKEEGKTFDEEEQELFAVARKKAKMGYYQFYKDTFDRVYGKPSQPIDHDGEVQHKVYVITTGEGDSEDKPLQSSPSAGDNQKGQAQV